MNTVGIVAEYNPFHSGHAYHIAQTKLKAGEDAAIVCVMSGDFVQRGEAAAYGKFARAEAACRCGADLVLELPLPWAISSAEGFARGAVGLLDSLGAVTHLSFGSESGDIDELRQTAECLIDPSMNAAIKAELGGGISYAVARQEALRKKAPELAAVLDTPNNILAVEYIKAILELGARMEPITVKRAGAPHDAKGSSDGVKSAADIRHKLAAGADVSAYMPPAAAAVYNLEERAGRGFMTMDALEVALLSRLRLMDVETFERLPDGAAGVGRALYNAVREEAALDAVIARAKSRGVAMSRIRRMVLCAALGVSGGMAEGTPPYARVLALNETGRAVLKAAAADIPILTKPASVRSQSARCESVFSLGSDAHDLYVLGYRARAERRPGEDWRAGPYIE